MTGPEHYRTALALAEDAERATDNAERASLAALATAHATIAQVALTADLASQTTCAGGPGHLPMRMANERQWRAAIDSQPAVI